MQSNHNHNKSNSNLTFKYKYTTIPIQTPIPTSFLSLPSPLLLQDDDDLHVDPRTDGKGLGVDHFSTPFSAKGVDEYNEDDDARWPWARLQLRFEGLNRQARDRDGDGDDEGVRRCCYKLLFMGRHGEGVHNVAERRYGTQAWDAKWARLEGDDHGEWIDARLTSTGEEQARCAGGLWAAQMKQSIPLPQSYYISPLWRCLQTAELTFGNLPLPQEKPFKATIKEMLRETMGVHTCDKRSSKSRTHALFQEAFDCGRFAFEDGFVEDDEVYQPDHRETHAETDDRLRSLLDDIFTHDASECISLTSHSGAIASILRVVGHRPFALQTGAVIAVLVKAEKIRLQ